MENLKRLDVQAVNWLAPLGIMRGIIEGTLKPVELHRSIVPRGLKGAPIMSN